MVAATASAKSLQSCPILRNPIDGSPPGSSVPGTLQARTLEWVAISFSRGSPNPGIEPRSPTLQAGSLPAEPPGKPKALIILSLTPYQIVVCNHFLYFHSLFSLLFYACFSFLFYVEYSWFTLCVSLNVQQSDSAIHISILFHQLPFHFIVFFSFAGQKLLSWISSPLSIFVLLSVFCLHSQLLFGKVVKNIQWEKDSLFKKSSWENWTSTCKRIKSQLFFQHAQISTQNR